MLASGPLLGLAAGWLFRGDIRRLAAIRVHWWWLLVLAVVLRLVAGSAGQVAAAVYLAAFAGIVAVALLNRRLPGMAILAAGALLNLAVVAANGGMPVDAAAVAAAGARMPEDALHQALDGSTRLAPLADRIPVGIFRGVYSIGDVLLTAGGFWLPFAAMVRR